MVRVVLTKHEGRLVRLEARGHSGWGSSGNDIVCASATALMRSAARAAAERFPRLVGWDAPEPGVLLVSLPEGPGEWLDGIAAVLETGLKDLQREYPQSLTVEVAEGHEVGNEVSHGT